MAQQSEVVALNRFLKPIHLWSIAVGLVISGEYFGWSYGWGVAGTIGFLIATLFVALMYTTFVFSFTELTTAIPHAGGPFSYANAALGPWAGFLAGYSTLIEFIFAPPAIAFALGSYTHFVFPNISVQAASIGVLLIFSGINLLGVHHTARFELGVTLLAVIELLLFLGIALPHFSWENFSADAFPVSFSGVSASIPYAIWFFLAIEGVAMCAEEVENPTRDIPMGYVSGIATLLILALGVMLASGGVGDWKALSHMDYPIPEALAMALGKNHPLVKMLAGIGIFGLIASLNGIIYSCSRQVFALARAGLLPRVFSKVNSRSKSPHGAVLLSCSVGLVSILSGKTSELITLSAMGAVSMYVICMISLFALRKQQPDLPRPFKVPLYPFFPAIALVTSAMSLAALFYYNPSLASLYLAFIIIGMLYFGFRNQANSHDHQSSPNGNWNLNSNPTLNHNQVES